MSGLRLRRMISTRDPESLATMGTQKIPVFDHALATEAGTWWSLSYYDAPDEESFDQARMLLRGADYRAETDDTTGVTYHVPTSGPRDTTIIGNFTVSQAGQGRLVIARGDWNLSDIGMSVVGAAQLDNRTGATRVNLAKLAKRVRSLTRPVRLGDAWQYLRVKVIEGRGDELDGASWISSRIVDQLIDNMYAHGERWTNDILGVEKAYIRTQKVFNGIIFGNSIDWQTGLALNKMIKGQFIVADLGDDVDLIVPDHNLKGEIFGGNHAIVALEPQGPKVAREDSQTIANMGFICTADDAEARMQEDLETIYDHFRLGEADKFVKTAVTPVTDTDNGRSDDPTASGWTLRRLYAAGVSVHHSPWALNTLARTQLGRYRYGGNEDRWRTTAAVPLHCGIRAQMISASLHNLANEHTGDEDLDPAPGEAIWSERYSVLVVSDDDWVNVVIPSHGGCDQDDFFLLRWVTIDGEKKIIATRSPNTRGEYSIWDYHKEDWHPVSRDIENNTYSFPELEYRPGLAYVDHARLDRAEVEAKGYDYDALFDTYANAPIPILDAIALGVTQYQPLPSVDAAEQGHIEVVDHVPWDVSMVLEMITSSWKSSG